MGKTLEEKMQEIEISLTEIKTDLKYVIKEINRNSDLEKRVRTLEDTENKLRGAAVLAGVVSGIISTIFVKIILSL